jgi:hypothetical protein
MRRLPALRTVRPVSLLAALTLLSCGQICRSQAAPQHPGPGSSLNTSGQLARAGHSVPYLIRRLPVSSFPDLPEAVQAELGRRGCLIPQTYEAHEPENVVHGSFERPGSSDWAVLCSAGGTVSLLVFFGSRLDRHFDRHSGRHADQEPFVLASAPETERLQPHPPASALGFNWAIDSASPRQVHDAQAGLEPRPPAIDHDALADSTIDNRTVYHFYANDAWTLLDTPGQ